MLGLKILCPGGRKSTQLLGQAMRSVSGTSKDFQKPDVKEDYHHEESVKILRYIYIDSNLLSIWINISVL